MQKHFILCLALSLLASACTPALTEESAEKSEVKLEICMPGDTRANGEMLYPINVFYTAKGGDEIQGLQTITSGTTLSLSLYKGEYDIYAVCGLLPEKIPASLQTNIITPATLSEWNNDFAEGMESLTVSPDVANTQSLQITANHQMAQLDVTVTDVPSSVSDMKLFVRGVCDTYNLDILWSSSSSTTVRSVLVPMTKSTTASATFECKSFVPPTSPEDNVSFVVAVTYSSGKTSFLSYTSKSPMSLGTHFKQTLRFNQLIPVDGSISIEDWNSISDNGVMSDPFLFSVGEQYLSYPATIAEKTESSLKILSHKPLAMTLTEVSEIEHFHSLSVAGLPEIPVSNWILPVSDEVANQILSTLNALGLNALNKQIESTGNTAIDENATNILAYVEIVNPSGTISERFKFFRYNFKTWKCEEVTFDPNTEYLIYPIGNINL